MSEQSGQPDDRDSTRDRIVAATAELFRSQGFNGTSLKQVTIGADAPVGSIYHFFPGGKDQLGATVIRESGAAYQALFELIAEAATDVADAVGSFFSGAADVLDETDFIDICPIGNVAREVASTHEPLRLATADVLNGWTTAVSHHLQVAGLREGTADDLANTIIAALEGGFLLARARRDTNDLRTTGRHMQQLVAAALS